MVHITEKKKPQSEVQWASPGDPCLRVLAPGRDLLWGSHSADLQWRAPSLTSQHQGNTTSFLNLSPTQWWVMMEGSSSVAWSMVALFPGIPTLLQGVWHPDALLIQQVIYAPILVGTCTEKKNSPGWSDRYKHSACGGGATGHFSWFWRGWSWHKRTREPEPTSFHVWHQLHLKSPINLSQTLLLTRNRTFKASSGIKNNSQHVHAAKCVHLLPDRHQRLKFQSKTCFNSIYFSTWNLLFKPLSQH